MEPVIRTHPIKRPASLSSNTARPLFPELVGVEFSEESQGGDGSGLPVFPNWDWESGDDPNISPGTGATGPAIVAQDGGPNFASALSSLMLCPSPSGAVVKAARPGGCSDTGDPVPNPMPVGTFRTGSFDLADYGYGPGDFPLSISASNAASWKDMVALASGPNRYHQLRFLNVSDSSYTGNLLIDLEASDSNRARIVATGLCPSTGQVQSVTDWYDSHEQRPQLPLVSCSSPMSVTYQVEYEDGTIVDLIEGTHYTDPVTLVRFGLATDNIGVVRTVDLGTGAVTDFSPTIDVGLRIQVTDTDQLGNMYIAACSSPVSSATTDGFIQKRSADGTLLWQYDFVRVYDMVVAANGRVAAIDYLHNVRMIEPDGTEAAVVPDPGSRNGLSIESLDGDFVIVGASGNNARRIPWGATTPDYEYVQGGWSSGVTYATKEHVVVAGGRSRITLFDQATGTVLWNNTDFEDVGNETAAVFIDTVNECVWFLVEQGSDGGVNQINRIDIATGLITDAINTPTTTAKVGATHQYHGIIAIDGDTLYVKNDSELTRYPIPLAAATWSTDLGNRYGGESPVSTRVPATQAPDFLANYVDAADLLSRVDTANSPFDFDNNEIGLEFTAAEDGEVTAVRLLLANDTVQAMSVYVNETAQVTVDVTPVVDTWVVSVLPTAIPFTAGDKVTVSRQAVPDSDFYYDGSFATNVAEFYDDNPILGNPVQTVFNNGDGPGGLYDDDDNIGLIYFGFDLAVAERAPES